MKIANPIYDVVFKYMLEDSKVAKIFLSALTDLDIVELEFLPQELSVEKDRKQSPIALSIYRLDFSATIRKKDGTKKQILIEVQKTKMFSESMRFRSYLGKQYMNPKLFQIQEDARQRKVKMGIPILTIYFLGEALEGLESYPVLHLRNNLEDRYGEQQLKLENKFLKSLYHEGIIVTIPALKKKRRDELEILLSIFDQANRTKDTHIMNVKVQDFPKQFQPIIRRLQGATKSKEVRDTMLVEDDFYNEIMEYEDRVKDALRMKEEERRMKEEERRMKEEAISLMLDSDISMELISQKLDIPLEMIVEISRKRK